MDSRKFCFIICSDSPLYLEECQHYLRHLVVPQGYTTDVLAIEGAASMTAGYNEGMRASDAMYKIYLHQDVFILNKWLLQDVLDLFAQDPIIGMIGMVGYKKMSSCGIMWKEPRLGAIYRGVAKDTYDDLAHYRYSLFRDGYDRVQVIDGLMMITRVDLSWDEEFDGWDFYDASQCARFVQSGYGIVVPRQRHPWCLHDASELNNMGQYDKYRKQFQKKYGKITKKF